MLSTKHLYRLGFASLVGALLSISGTREANSEAGHGSGSGAPRATPVRLASTPHVFERAPFVAQDCPLGAPSSCFDSLSTTALNPASFFDNRQVSDVEHFFMKLYRNETGNPVVVEGMGFESRTNNASFNRFQSAGGIFAGADALFPSPEALLALPVVEIRGQPPGNLTCIEFPTAIDTRGSTIGLNLTLQPGEVAWLVLRFIAAPSNVFVGILMDDDDNDQPCDYLTIDGGLTWYQPDPVHGPKYDWGITAFTSAGVGEPQPSPPTWSTVKSLYRD